jgi:hypothetical protein
VSQLRAADLRGPQLADRLVVEARVLALTWRSRWSWRTAYTPGICGPG